MERFHTETSDGRVAELDQAKRKIALMPFVEGGHLVHVFDGGGKAYPARERSVEDDFRLAVQSLWTEERGDDKEEVGTEDGEKLGRTKSHTGSSEDRSDPVNKLTKGSNGNPATQDTEKAPVGSDASKPAPSPPEHPLQKAINSFDMALGELNQLIHLIDLARAREFMSLERVTPKDDRAREASDLMGGPGEAFLLGGVSETVRLHTSRLKGAASRLRERAKRLRETTKVQSVFQRDVVKLRKNWRIVAPNHGKVQTPLQVGETLAVDCSYDGEGANPAPSAAPAAARQRHPWLFHLARGPEGRLEAEAKQGHLKTLEVQLISASSGLCESSLRAAFPTWRRDGREVTSDTVEDWKATQHTSVEPCTQDPLDTLEQQIARVQHSVFWGEVFECIKAEAVVLGRHGWLAHQGRVSEGAHGHVSLRQEASGAPAESTPAGGAGTKRRLAANGSVASSARDVGGEQVVHVLDDEVMVKMNNRFLLGYRLVPCGDVAGRRDEARRKETARAAHGAGVRASSLDGGEDSDLTSLCRLALFYSGSMLRQHHGTRAAEGGSLEAKNTPNRPGQPILKAEAPMLGGGRPGAGGSGRPPAGAGNIWRSVARVLRHMLFFKEVLGGLGRTSHVLRRIGLPLTVHWTHLETTCAESSWSITLGSCFHFQISLDDEPRVIVSSLPGLENPALHRRVELPSAVAFHHFLLGEICRQIVLTFGDIASARMKRVNREGCRFEVQLIPPAMHLSTEVAAASRTTRAVDYARLEGEGGAEDATHRGRCEVRVFADEVGVHISCTALPKSSGPLYGRGNMGKLLLDNNRYTDDVFDIIEGGLSTERWEGLDGSDVFSKFSSLLALVYPLKQQQPT